MANKDNKSMTLPIAKVDEWYNQLRKDMRYANAEYATYDEIDKFLPAFVFLERFYAKREDGQQIDIFGEYYQGGLTFLNNDMSPYYISNSPDGVRWFPIEPRNYMLLKHYIVDIQPERYMKNGVEGWLIPLRESDGFNSWEDANAYLHNLMFWESMVSIVQAGPLVERYTFIAQRLYRSFEEQRQLCDELESRKISPFLNRNMSYMDIAHELLNSIDRMKKDHEDELDKQRRMMGADMAKAMDRMHRLEELIMRTEKHEKMFEFSNERSALLFEEMQKWLMHFENEQQEAKMRQMASSDNLRKVLEEVKELLKDDKK